MNTSQVKRGIWNAGAARVVLAAIAMMLAGAASAAGQATSQPADSGSITITVNKTRVITTALIYKRLSIGQPDVADVTAIGPTKILLTAKKPGTTELIVWDEQDHTQTFAIVVEMDLQPLRDQLKSLIPDSKIDATAVNGTVALSGRVSNLQDADRATQMAAPYSGNGKVVNLLEVSGGQQVMLQVRFAEVDRTAKESFGFDGFLTDGTFSSGFGNGPQPGPIGGVASGNVSGTTVPNVALFGGGRIGTSQTTFEYFLNCLRQNNLLRTLAEPNLVTISGQEATFLAGGEFPVPVPQSSGSGTTITIEYKDFGVKLTFTPVVMGNGRIRLRVAPEVSQLDFTTAVQFSGFVVPGLSTRSLATTVEMSEGQTLALAGLLNNNLTANKSVTPVLGDLPVIGALFRSVSYQHQETELVVMVTPRLVAGLNPGHVPELPGEHWRYPSEAEIFWNADLGGDIVGPATRPTTGEPAPKFHGDYGFSPATATTDE
jgi:pilus assembly protein CpaC